MTAHAPCRCSEAGGTAACPVHGGGLRSGSTSGTNANTMTVAWNPAALLVPLRCSVCGQELQARWQNGATVEDRYIAVEPHRCPTQDVRVVNAEDLSDDELLAAVKARGLSGMAG